MIVTPNMIPVRHSGIRYQPGEEFEIGRKGYERIADYLSVIEEDAPENEKPIDKLTVPELRELAEKKNIDLGDASKKEDIVAIIQGALKQGNGDGS